jgi:RNA polymerase sigma factor (sigma-70 family)
MSEVPVIASHFFRENAGRMHAVLTNLLGPQHLDLVMDAVQDAFEAALVQWRFGGVPEDPAAWLMRVAKNKAISAVRRTTRAGPLPAQNGSAEHPAEFEDHAVPDPQFRLLLTCVHPSFSLRKQVAFTLKVLCGFGVQEIARALLMEHDAVKKMIQRAQQELRELHEDRELPVPSLDAINMSAVHAVVYLMFNEGYKTTRGKDQLDLDLCYEAIRLSKMLLQNDVPEAHATKALLALMFFNLARFPARMDEDGVPIPLEEQRREKWDAVFIREGYSYLNAIGTMEEPGRYYLEALIASMHCAAADHASTDWQRLAYLYALLERIAPSPAVTLNRIAAVGYAIGPHAALQELHQAATSGTIGHDHMYHATLADLHRRNNDHVRAVEAYSTAQKLAASPLEKQFFAQRIVQCDHILNS